MKRAAQPGQPIRRPRHVSGFTLIEVLVALGIVAVALMTGLKATGALSHNAERQTLAMLGQICADNELIRLRLQRQMPNIGSTQSPCLQASLELQVELVVQPTPNPNFRRVDARVLHQGQGILQVSTIMGQG